MMKVMSCCCVMALAMAIWPEWKKVPSPMNTICLLVMKGSTPAPVAAAEAHAAVVVHERLVGLEHHHGVAAGVAVGDEVHGLLP